MMGKIFQYVLIIIFFICFMVSGTALSFVKKEGDKTFIVDRAGESWDVTQAESISFKSERFQYGIGMNAFTSLDDSELSDNVGSASGNLRILGVDDGSQAKAYSIQRLRRHEIANSKIGSEPIAVGF